jgi:hypothetical protein
MLVWLYSLICLSFGSTLFLGDGSEPYEEEGYYITAEEYHQLTRGHIRSDDHDV